MPVDRSLPDLPEPRIDTTRIHSEPAAASRVLAVVSDGSALRGGGREIAPESLAPLLDDDAAGLRWRADIPVRAVPLSAHDSADLAGQLCNLPDDTGAVFLTHTEPNRARAAVLQAAKTGGPPVVTDTETMAIALAAALLTAVMRAGRNPEASRVVIAGSAAIPELCPLLMTVGIGDISSWNAADAYAFPLQHLASYATAVIDLIGATAGFAARFPSKDGATVISAEDPGYRLLPAPGLFSALLHYPNARPDVDVLRACVLGLVAATPPGRLTPELEDPHLAEAIASTVLRILAQRTPASHGDLPGE